MAKQFAEGFYKSQAWKNCRDEYAKSKGYLCEKCIAEGKVKAGVIVHHVTELTPHNIEVPEVALGWDNLMLLCRDCHAEMHRTKKRYTVGPNGEVVCNT